jgi:hypothetical protein
MILTSDTYFWQIGEFSSLQSHSHASVCVIWKLMKACHIILQFQNHDQKAQDTNGYSIQHLTRYLTENIQISVRDRYLIGFIHAEYLLNDSKLYIRQLT